MYKKTGMKAIFFDVKPAVVLIVKVRIIHNEYYNSYNTVNYIILKLSYYSRL